MRIAHVTDCYLPRLGGIELQVRDLAARQAARHDVTVFTTTVGAGDAGNHGGIEVVSASAGRGPAEKIHYLSSHQGRAAVLGGGFDVVHVHASSFSPYAFLAAHDASLRGIPTVATVHSLWAKATPLFKGADVLAGWGNWPVVFSAVSSAAAASARRILGGRSTVTVLPNGIDPTVWKVAHDGGTAGELRLAVVSRLAHRKRILPMLSMLSSARGQLPPGVQLRADILGDGPQRARVERYLRRHSMDWVNLRGRCSRSEIRDTFGRSDLFVAPAKLESFGIAALEARCAGLPIIALSGTGVEDFVVHGREGWLVRSDRAMVETIASLARSPELVRRVADHNRTVPPSITWPVVLRRCDALYRQAAIMHGRSWPAPASPRSAAYLPHETDQVVSER
ncbi:MAG TPA: glycosyltransferase family 4 protein [Acidimicrobiales bacterium]|nr:glycosyltransferase family 4 protein [Acidimicrobiales bacterium]